jgi:hypothetical protein
MCSCKVLAVLQVEQLTEMVKRTTMHGESDQRIVLCAWESHVHGEAADNITQLVKETYAGHCRTGTY